MGKTTNEFISSTGAIINVTGVSPLLLQKIQASFEKKTPKPVIPTYEAESAGGDIEVLPHNETTVSTEEEKEQWEKYKKEKEQWDRELNEKVLRALILKGVVMDVDDSAEWVQEQEFLGIDIPDDKNERKIHYFETEVVGSASDVFALVTEIMKLSGLDEEAIADAESLFRSELQRGKDNPQEHLAE